MKKKTNADDNGITKTIYIHIVEWNGGKSVVEKRSKGKCTFGYFLQRPQEQSSLNIYVYAYNKATIRIESHFIHHTFMKGRGDGNNGKNAK